MPVLKKTLKILILPVKQINNLKAKFVEYAKRSRVHIPPTARLYPSSAVIIGVPRQSRTAITIGDFCRILGELLIYQDQAKIHIGSHCFIGPGTRVWAANSIVIGDRVLISHGVNIHDGNSHSLSAGARHEHFLTIFSTGHPMALDDVSTAPVVIEDDAWIGFNSSILKGVKIGRGAVVAACSVVTKDVDAFDIVAGNPARVVGRARE